MQNVHRRTEKYWTLKRRMQRVPIVELVSFAIHAGSYTPELPPGRPSYSVGSDNVNLPLSFFLSIALPVA